MIVHAHLTKAEIVEFAILERGDDLSFRLRRKSLAALEADARDTARPPCRAEETDNLAISDCAPCVGEGTEGHASCPRRGRRRKGPFRLT